MNILKKGIICLGMLSAMGAATYGAEPVLTVYSTRHYDSDKAIIKEFTEKTGIKVEVVKGKGKALLQKLASEGKDSQADIFFTADAGNLAKAKEAGFFQELDSKVIDENIPVNLRDKDDKWTALTKRARVIVYSKDRVNPAELSTYEDLADPKWKGKILVRSSSNQYNISLVSSFLDDKIMGKEKTEKWLKGFVANLARTPKGNDRAQGKAVYAGEGDIAIMNTYYIGKMLNDKKDPTMKAAGENIAVFFPNQQTTGTHVNVSGAGILKTADNKEAAVKFLEFLSSDEAQEKFSSANYEFPANPKVEVKNEFLKSLGEFKAQDINLTVLGENAKEAVKLMDEAGWK
ncbi:MAG: Fe(3+) ABC transporter substrate-binding protein [Fusobacteriales bacterium]|nr:MAG: Fe(3+) ABC transporter substrate-binding protein [Fusobacteriales bacterium]